MTTYRNSYLSSRPKTISAKIDILLGHLGQGHIFPSIEIVLLVLHKAPLRPLCSDYFFQNQKLVLRTEAKYLEVTIGSDLSWSRHADNITMKANSTMGFLKRNIRSAAAASSCKGNCLQDLSPTNCGVCRDNLGTIHSY